jgi:hypothetical protein
MLACYPSSRNILLPINPVHTAVPANEALKLTAAARAPGPARGPVWVAVAA